MNTVVRGASPPVDVRPGRPLRLPRTVLQAAGLALALIAGLALAAALTGTGAHGPARRASLSGLPFALREQASAAIGADQTAYWARPASTGLLAANPGQGLQIGFRTHGVSVAAGPVEEVFGLLASGNGNVLHPLGVPRMSSSRNLVSYSAAPVQTWYRNGPLGLEQGFSVPRPAAAPAGGALTLALALRGSAAPALAPDGRSITFARDGTVLRYSNLAATDAAGRSLASRMQLVDGRLLLRVQVGPGARYPLQIDPVFQQVARLEGGEGERGGGHLGRSVALSANGTTALVGAPHDDGEAGAAWVFTKSGSTWTQQASLSVEGKGLNYFGRSVALSGDGNTALVGAPGVTGGRGAVWVFTRSGSTWTEQAELTGGSAEEGAGQFGRSVALSAQGTLAIVGAYADASLTGAAWVFTGSGPTWTQQGGKLTGGGEQGQGEFGRAVAVSGDGTEALIGGSADNGHRGAVWLFAPTGGVWTQKGEKVAPEVESSRPEFGAAVALSGNGELALVGAPAAASNVGAAWLYARSGGTLTPVGSRLTGSGESGEGRFGESVALSADGSSALIGAPANAGGVGAVWALERSGAGFGSGEVLTETAEGTQTFGRALALSEKGVHALVGGYLSNSQRGSAWVYDREGVVEEPEEKHEETTTTEEHHETTETHTETTPTTTTATTATTTSTTTGIGNQTPKVGVLGAVSAAAPIAAVSGNVAPVAGSVLVKLPGGGFALLNGEEEIPFGAIIDATNGRVRVTVSNGHGGQQTGEFFGGVFVLTQRPNGTVLARLYGGNFTSCPTRHRHHGVKAQASAKHSSGKHVVRKLWANAHGSFSTQGNYAAGAVQGTEWLTEDLCEGTLIRVTRDKVRVTNLITHRHRIVFVGHQELVRAP